MSGFKVKGFGFKSIGRPFFRRQPDRLSTKAYELRLMMLEILHDLTIL